MLSRWMGMRTQFLHKELGGMHELKGDMGE